jgi:hypothetical protein
MHPSTHLLRRHGHPLPHPPQQHNSITSLQHSPQLLSKIQQPPTLNMENSQLVLLALNLIIQILNLQTLRRQIQHSAHAVLGRIEEIALGDFGRDGV